MNEIARRIYEEIRDRTPPRDSFLNEWSMIEMPRWEELTYRERDAWISAVKAVLEA